MIGIMELVERVSPSARQYRVMGSEVGRFRCSEHGRVDRKIFVTPLPWKGGVAHYECFHCWHAIGEPEFVTDGVSRSGKEGQDHPNTPQPAPQREEEETDQRAEDSREQFYSIFPGGHA